MRVRGPASADWSIGTVPSKGEFAWTKAGD